MNDEKELETETVPTPDAAPALTDMPEGIMPEVSPKVKWAAFVEGEAADFFTGYKLEKMTLEDGNGNKAKLGRTKDGGIKIEYTSTVLI